MTEPKKEKCEACCGSGYINFWTDDGHISMRTCRRCDGYGYIKAKPLTNEEWFTSLSTEEKAEFSMRVFKNCTWCLDGGSPQECPFNEFLDCPAESKENIVKWLEEIHEE